MKHLLWPLILLTGFTLHSCSQKSLHPFDSSPGLSNDWINKHVQPIELNQADFSDLQFLKDEIGERRIVALGEQTHQDGKTFELRARIIEFLMEEMDFDVVLFEAGMFDVNVAQRITQESGQISDLTPSLYGFWRNAVQHEALFAYWQQRLDAGQPLEFAGFDCKLTSPYGRSQGYYSSQLQALLEQADGDVLTQPEAQEYFAIWTDIEAEMAAGGISSISYRMKEDEKHRLRELSEWIQAQVSPLSAEWAQMVRTVDESVILYSEVTLTRAVFNQQFIIDHVNNPRDELMAENLRFLVQERFADRKIILIGATYHFIRNNDLLIAHPESKVAIEQSTIMGDLVYPDVGEEMYIIGFTAGGGYYGEVEIGKEGQAVPPPVVNSLEAELLDEPFAQAFVPLRAASDAPEFWDYGPHLNLFYYDLGIASKQWPEVLDAVIYLRDMEPVFMRP